MPAERKPLNGLIITGIVILFVFGANWIEFAFQPDNIWWTPATMKLSMDDASDRVLTFVNDTELSEAVASGNLVLKTEGGDVILAPGDIGYRVNNWHRYRSMQLWRVALDASMTTLAVTLLVLGLYFYNLKKKESHAEETAPLQAIG